MADLKMPPEKRREGQSFECCVSVFGERQRRSHLLQTGGVELRLINDLYSHLEAKQVRVNLL